MSLPPVCVSINVSDCSGGSGTQADLKTFTALGTYGAGVLTGLLAQTLGGANDQFAIPESFVRSQLDSVQDLPIAAVKIGMCPTAATIRVVGRWLRERPSLPVVVDPVLANHIGIPLQQPEVIEAMRQELLPRATLITPNRFEAAQLTGVDEVLDVKGMEEAAKRLFDTFGCPTVVTGGGMADYSLDVYCGMDGISHFSSPVLNKGRVFGAGSTYAATLAVQLAKGESTREAIIAAKNYIEALIRAAPVQERGDGSIVCGPLNHCQHVQSYASGQYTTLPDPGDVGDLD